MTQCKSFCLAVALFATSAVAMATEVNAPKTGVLAGIDASAFPQADKNNDGFLERTEAGEIKGLNFAKADADSDGKISWAEFEQAMTQRAANKTAKSNVTR